MRATTRTAIASIKNQGSYFLPQPMAESTHRLAVACPVPEIRVDLCFARHIIQICGLHNCLFVYVALCNWMRRLCSALKPLSIAGTGVR